MKRRVDAVATGAALTLVGAMLAVVAGGSTASAAACIPAQLIANPGFETGSAPWTATAGVIGSFPSQPPHSGTGNAWLDGDGVKHTDTLSQSVSLPAGCTIATLSYWLHIDTAETSATAVKDRLTVTMGGTTVASYSNVDKNVGYLQRTIDVSAFAGQTVTLTYTGVENASKQTSFVIDDVALDVSAPVSQDPVVTNPGDQTSSVGTPVSLKIVATDPQGDTLAYSASGVPAGLSINSSTGLISGTPTTPGTSSVTVTATDPGSHSGSAAFTWTVNPAGTDPTRTPAQGGYTLTLTSDSIGGTWTGHETISFTNVSPLPLPEVYLRLWDNYHGSCPSNQPIQISNTTGGTAGALEVNCTAIKITLPAPLSQNQSGTVGFDVSIVVPNVSDRFGRDGSYNFIGNAIPVLAVRDGAGWHLDPYTNNGESFYQLASDFTVTLDHPTSVLTPTTGTASDAPGAPGRTITTATATSVREFAWVAGPFSMSTTTTPSGVVFNTWWTTGITSSSAASMQSTGVSAMEGHAGRFEAYPYGEVDLVLHNNFWFGGMEYPGLVLSQASSVPVIHELGHQWWYGIVGDDEYTSPWLDEGFTDYATDLQRGILGTNCWASVSWQSAQEKITNSMAYWDANPSRYGTVVYTYGKCALHDLRRTIGDTSMTNLMASYAAAHWYGVSTVAEFKAAAQAATTTDLTTFWTTHRIEG